MRHICACSAATEKFRNSAENNPDREYCQRVQQVDLRYRLKRDVPWIIAFASLLQAILVIVTYRYGYDSHAYWLAWRHDLYGGAPNTPDAFLYSPAFAQLIWPLAQLPWPVFAAVYSLVLLSVLTWLLKPLPLRLAIPLGLAGLNEVMAGNVFLLFAVVAVLGFRYPAGWAFVALTKVTPCVGPVWFLVRREWRNLAMSLLATGAVALVSFGIAPDQWAHWFEFLTAHQGEVGGSVGAVISPPLIVRLPLGVALVVWGALKDKRWTLLASMAIATPVFGLGAFAVLLALPRLNEPRPTTAGKLGRPGEQFARAGLGRVP